MKRRDSRSLKSSVEYSHASAGAEASRCKASSKVAGGACARWIWATPSALTAHKRRTRTYQSLAGRLYSHRSATAGSVRLARRIGMQTASSVTSRKKSTTAPYRPGEAATELCESLRTKLLDAAPSATPPASPATNHEAVAP